MKRLKKQEQQYRVEDIPTLWLDIKAKKANTMFKYMNIERGKDESKKKKLLKI
tara:strand:- start:722 stop:880 length:159 start_codon:yes stop_codon:yes gene_type:complete